MTIMRLSKFITEKDSVKIKYSSEVLKFLILSSSVDNKYDVSL